jgi:hypothetical protein
MFFSTLYLLAFFSYAKEGERVANWKIFENAKAPTFTISTDKTEYFIGESIAVRFVLKNETAVDIPIHEKALRFETSSVGAAIFAEKESHGIIQRDFSLANCGWEGGVYGSPVYLKPGETIVGDFILGNTAQTPQKYYVSASYYWRECNPKTPSEQFGACQFLYPEPLEINIVMPADSEKSALDYFQVPRLHQMLQTPFYGCFRACSKDTEVFCEDTPEFYISQARKFLERFPKSVYSRYMNYTLGIILRDQKNFQAAEEQMGKFIAQYPDDWMVDDAMFEMAECQIKQGMPDKAQATLESLFQKFPLTSTHQAKRVLENLKKGYKSMEKIYAH